MGRGLTLSLTDMPGSCSIPQPGTADAESRHHVNSMVSRAGLPATTAIPGMGIWAHSRVQCAQCRPGWSICCSTGCLGPWCQVGSAGGGQHCHGRGPRGPPDIPLPYPQAARLPTENPLLPAQPLPLGSEGDTAQTCEAAGSPSKPPDPVVQFNSSQWSQPQELPAPLPALPTLPPPLSPQPQPAPAPALLCWPGPALGRQQGRGDGSHWQRGSSVGAINTNRLTRCFDEAPLKLVHHQGPREHSGR